jgi:general secretion pathway protein D
MNNSKYKIYQIILPIMMCLVISSCKKQPQMTLKLPPKLVGKSSEDLGQGHYLGNPPMPPQGVFNTPTAPVPAATQRLKADEPKKLTGAPADFSLSQVPIPTFIKIVFGDTLKLDFEIDSDVASHKELVTLRTATKKTPIELYNIAKQVLSSYAIRIQRKGDLYRFVTDRALEGQIPLILRTRTSRDVPEDLRPIFQIVDIAAIDKKDMKKYLDSAFPGKTGNIIVSEDANALIVYDTEDNVRSMVEAIQIFDRPSFAGRKSVRVNLTFLTAENIATKLLDILQAEGYFVSDAPDKKSAITILPVQSLNSLIVFAADNTIISHIVSWVKELDVPTQVSPDGNFYYIPIRNAEAQTIGEVINQALAKSSLSSLTRASTLRNRRNNTRTGRNARNQNNRRPGSRLNTNRSGGKIVVDEDRNGLVFHGTAEEFAQIKPLIEQMDVPAREVLIEVTIAEYQLSDNQSRGFEGVLKKATSQFSKQHLFSRTASLLTNAVPGADVVPLDLIKPTGFNYTLINSAKRKEAILNLMHTETHTTVLSSPRLLTRSGVEAKFNQSQRIPLIQSRSVNENATQSPTTTLKYEDVGTILTITPTIRAGRRVDIKVVQEVSDIGLENFGGTGSASIDKTIVDTDLSLADGESVLMAGFIRDKVVHSENGIPILKDIPGIGPLFRTDTDGKEKRELILLITPYIIETNQEASDVTAAFKKRLSWLGNG